MRRRGIRARDIARQLDVAENSVNNWRANKTLPRDEHARQLAEMLDLPEIEVRVRLGLYVPREALHIDVARRRLEILREAAKTRREREAFDEIARALDGD